MSRAWIVYAIAFAESFAAVLVGRGIFFYAHHRLEFNANWNLCLALAAGGVYVFGAMPSHRFAGWLGERRMLMLVVATQCVVHLLAASRPDSIWTIFGVSAAISWLNAVKWPVIQSYAGAGHDEGNSIRSLGWFNYAWAGAVPLSMAVTGPLIEWSAQALFVLGAVINLGSLALVWRLAAVPPRLPHDHPTRPNQALLTRYRAMLASSRYTMLTNYALLLLVLPLLPMIFQERLGYSVVMATLLASLIDWTRLLAFVWMTRSRRWLNRGDVLAAAAIAMPAMFCFILFGQHVAVVLAGELFFGLSAGVVYFAALYYAMIVKNASVDAGGGHETMIGAGFTVGPVAGLAGRWLTGVVGSAPWGMLLGVAPVLIAGLAGGLWPLRRLRRGGRM